MRETWKNSVENIVEYSDSNTQPPKVFWPEQCVWKCTNTEVQTHTHIPKNTQISAPASCASLLPRCPSSPRNGVWLSLPLLIDVTSTCMAVTPGSQENPVFYGGCWRKPSSPQTKGRGHVLNDGAEVLMRYLAKSTTVAAVIPSAGGFTSGGRGIRKTQSLPMRKTSCSLFHPGVWVPALASARKPGGQICIHLLFTLMCWEYFRA